MKKLTLALMLMLAFAVSALAQATDTKAKAEQVLKQARAAIGSESKLKGLQALSAEGVVIQNSPQGRVETPLQIEMMTPDKIKKTTDGQRGTSITALNGSKIWTDFVPPVGGGGFGGGGNRPGGPGGFGGPGATAANCRWPLTGSNKPGARCCN